MGISELHLPQDFAHFEYWIPLDMSCPNWLWQSLFLNKYTAVCPLFGIIHWLDLEMFTSYNHANLQRFIAQSVMWLPVCLGLLLMIIIIWSQMLDCQIYNAWLSELAGIVSYLTLRVRYIRYNPIAAACNNNKNSRHVQYLRVQGSHNW